MNVRCCNVGLCVLRQGGYYDSPYWIVHTSIVEIRDLPSEFEVDVFVLGGSGLRFACCLCC